MSDDRFEKLLRGEEKSLMAHCRRLSGNRDDAGDLMSSTLLKAWRYRHRFVEGKSLQNWLFSIAKRLWLDLLRERARRPVEVDPSDMLDDYDGITNPYDNAQDGAASIEDRLVAEVDLLADLLRAGAVLGRIAQHHRDVILDWLRSDMDPRELGEDRYRYRMAIQAARRSAVHSRRPRRRSSRVSA